MTICSYKLLRQYPRFGTLQRPVTHRPGSGRTLDRKSILEGPRIEPTMPTNNRDRSSRSRDIRRSLIRP